MDVARIICAVATNSREDLTSEDGDDVPIVGTTLMVNAEAYDAARDLLALVAEALTASDMYAVFGLPNAIAALRKDQDVIAQRRQILDAIDRHRGTLSDEREPRDGETPEEHEENRVARRARDVEYFRSSLEQINNKFADADESMVQRALYSTVATTGIAAELSMSVSALGDGDGARAGVQRKFERAKPRTADRTEPSVPAGRATRPRGRPKNQKTAG
jgi:hypothetical protein